MAEYAQVLQKVKEIVAEQLHKKVEEISDHATLESLGADSLDRVELIMKIEEAFSVEISDEAAERLNTVADAAQYIVGLMK